MIKGIIFDFDGVLVDSMSIWDNLASSYLLNQNIIPEKNLDKKIANLSYNQGIDYIQKTYLLNKTTTIIKEELNNYLTSVFTKKISLKPSIKDLLITLNNHQIPLIIASTNNYQIIKQTCINLNIISYFNQIITCDQLNTDKNKPDIFYYCCDLLKAKPKQIYLIEDNLNSLQEAKKLGFNLVGIYDNHSKNNQDKIKDIVDIYIDESNNFNTLEEKINENMLNNSR